LIQTAPTTAAFAVLAPEGKLQLGHSIERPHERGLDAEERRIRGSDIQVGLSFGDALLDAILSPRSLVPPFFFGASFFAPSSFGASLFGPSSFAFLDCNSRS